MTAGVRSASYRSRRARGRGFTLVELMAVVAIMAVLATVAFAAFQQRAYGAKLSEAQPVLQAIGAAEEQFRALNQVYLDVSTGPGTPGSGWYPRDTAIPANAKVSFISTGHADYAPVGRRGWRYLNPAVRQPVNFVYKVNAGLPELSPSTVAIASGAFTIDANAGTEPWYVAQARAAPRDWSGGRFCVVVKTSFSPEVRFTDQCY